MATLNIRYGGKIVSLPEGANFSPGNYGTARLKYRVNSTSVGELGLTTHTDAKAYCGLQMRVGGQICYIGRVSTTSYISGDTVDYHDSSMGDRYASVSSSSEYATSTAKRNIDYYSSSMSTSTSQYTQVTSTQQIQTNSYTQQVWSNSYTYRVETRSYTNEVLTKTENYTYNAGNGNATSNANPGMMTWDDLSPTFATTSETVITRTASGQILSKSSFKETWYDSVKISESITNSWGLRWSPAESPGQTRELQYKTTRKTENIKYGYTMWNAHANAASTDPVATNKQTGGVTAYTWTYDKTTANGAVSTSYTNGASTVTDASGGTYSVSKTDNWYITTSHKINYIRVSTTYTTSRTVYSTGMTAGSTSRYRSQNVNSTTYGSYSSRWTYYWTSGVISVKSYYSTATNREYETRTSNEYSTRTIREYSTQSYTGSTYYSSITRSTTSVSETIHNMNL